MGLFPVEIISASTCTQAVATNILILIIIMYMKFFLHQELPFYKLPNILPSKSGIVPINPGSQSSNVGPTLY